MNSFDVELKALIDRWHNLGTSWDDICDALQDEADKIENVILAGIDEG